MNFVIVTSLIAVVFLQGITGQLDKQLGLASPLQLYAGETADANCTGRSGNICGIKATDCNSIFLCIPSMSDPIKVACDTGLFCNEGVCSTVKSPFCEYGDRKFKCSSEGIYPDPTSCKKFNYCVPVAVTNPPPPKPAPPTLTASQCDEGWGFNPATASCDKKLINGNCAATDRQVPSCLTTGQNGALKGNPSMYYICMAYDGTTDPVLYPSIFKCPGNTRYAGNYACK